jgi:hypothetical protein
VYLESRVAIHPSFHELLFVKCSSTVHPTPRDFRGMWIMFAVETRTSLCSGAHRHVQFYRSAIRRSLWALSWESVLNEITGRYLPVLPTSVLACACVCNDISVTKVFIFIFGVLFVNLTSLSVAVPRICYAQPYSIHQVNICFETDLELHAIESNCRKFYKKIDYKNSKFICGYVL